MKVCFSVGSSSEKVIESMSATMDNVEFFTYSSIQELIKESTMRHIFFDRIVFSEKILGDVEGDLVSLNNYLSEYSESTSVVLVCRQGDDSLCKIFSGIFKSPLYTPVIASKVTISVLDDFVNAEINTLKSRYFVTDSKEVKAIISKSPESKVVNNPEPVKKKGFFKGLFGSNKNVSQEIKTENSVKDSSETERKVSEEVGKTGFGLPSGNFVSDNRNDGFGVAGGDASEKDLERNESFSGNACSGLGSDNSGDEISSENQDYDDLSIGNYGEKHVDTGFLDEDDEEDIENELRLSEREYKDIDEEEYGYFDTNVECNILIIGDRGVGVSSYIAEYSVNLLEAGKKVLVVDFDYKKNGILSFVNTGKFLRGDYSRGISNLKPFYDDGIAVISNGYGFGISEKDISNLFKTSFRGYDVVLIDCPLDCAGLLNSSILGCCKIEIRVSGNRGSILSTMEGLTDRDNISGEIEDYLYKNSNMVIIDKIDEYEDDISFLRKNLIFGRYNWLSKLS